MTDFTKINIQAQVVNGNCPICTEESIFVSIYKTIFRCVTCGADIEQKINGKILYYYAMPFRNRNIWGATAGMLFSLYQIMKKQ